VVITSECDGLFLDNSAVRAVLEEVGASGDVRLRASALKLNFATVRRLRYRAFGRPRILADNGDVRLINSGVLDRHPELTVHVAHLAGGIAAMLGRIRCFQDKDFWGTKGNARHGMTPKDDFDHYVRNRLIFDTAGFAGAISSVKTGLVEIPASRIVFATDIRRRSASARSCATLCATSARSGRAASRSSRVMSANC